MTILSLYTEFSGQAGIQPRRGAMVTTDDLSTITTAGYINDSPSSAGITFSNGDFLFVVYNANAQGFGGTPEMFTISKSASGIITLVGTITSIPAYVQGIIPGNSAAGKALVLDSRDLIDRVPFADIKQAGDLVGGSPFYLITVSTTPASRTCTADFVFQSYQGVSYPGLTAFQFYISDSSGNMVSAITSLTSGAEGTVTELVTGQVALGVTNDSAGLEVILTAGPGTYHLAFIFPEGRVVTSPPLVVNA